MIQVASFDVFETMLVRRVGEPSAIFLLLGRDLSSLDTSGRVTPEIFARARTEAERRARRRIGPSRDPELASIYRELQAATGWTDEQRDENMRRELRLEARSLVANPVAVALLNQARERARSIAFTSDTYLSEGFLRAQLEAHGLLQKDDVVLASSEHGATKRAGSLFSVLARETGVSLHQIVHIGNDARADVTSAKAAGVRTRPATAGNLTADERLLDGYRWETGGLASALAGAARLGRLTAQARGEDRRDLQLAAADVTAPTLIAYVLWILRRAEERGLRALYFLSREGQALLEVAQPLREHLQIDIELRYLYGSRQSLNLAALDDPTVPDIAWTLTHAETNTARTLLSRLQLTPEAVAEPLRSIGIEPTAWDEVPDQQLRDRIFTSLCDGELRPYLETRVREARTITLAYLEQEGFLHPTRCGVVDVSGAGSQFKALYRLRQEAGLERPSGFLFVRSRDPYLANHQGYVAAEVPPIDAYFEDEVEGLGCGTTPGLPQLLEMFCAADHGTALRYETTDGGRVQPVLAGSAAPHLERWGLGHVRRAVSDVAENLWLDGGLVDLDGDLRPAIRSLLHRFWTQPTLEEARGWGSHPIQATSGADDEARSLASPYSAIDLGRAVVQRRVRDDAWFSWRYASARISPAPIRLFLSAARRAKGLARSGR